MKKILLTVTTVIIFSVSTLRAQEIDYGIRAGLNVSTTLSPDTDYFKSRAGLNIGVFADIFMTDNIFIQPALLYSLKGSKSKFDGFYEHSSLGKIDIKTPLHYLEVPVSAGYEFHFARFAVRAFTGPYFAIGLGGKSKGDVDLGGYDIPQVGMLQDGVKLFGDYLKRGDIGWNFGAGIKYRHFYGGLQYGVGMLNIGKGDEGFKYRNGNFSINFGYYF